MKKLLMLNASVFEIPLILTAKDQGFYVITTGNNPKAPAHKFADRYVMFDYSDYDGMVNLSKKLEIDAISQGCSDNCALTAAYISEQLGMSGHDSFENARIIHRKDFFKEFIAKSNMLSPKAQKFTNFNDAKNYDISNILPLIVKPNDQAGGKGVTKVCNTKEYLIALDKAFSQSNARSIVVEPFLEGSLHSFTTFIINGKVRAYATFNDYSFMNKFLTNSGVTPADNGEVAERLLIPEVEKFVAELKLVDGLLHMQYIMHNKKPWIIEMMRRMPGNNYVTALSRATGIDWYYWIIRAEAGLNCEDMPKHVRSNKYYGYHAIMSDKNGVFNGIEIDNEFKKKVTDFVEFEYKGKVIDDYLYQKFGLIQFCFDNSKEKDKLMKNINKLVHCI